MRSYTLDISFSARLTCRDFYEYHAGVRDFILQYDEALTCNVCDRSFSTRRQLSDHQQKKRHFGCSSCDSLFPSLMALEHHKEEFQHWSDSSYCSHSDSEDSDECHEDRHRLL